MNVNIDWILDGDIDRNRCLYAYIHPKRAQILYLGMAGQQTVRERLYGRHKRDLLRYLSEHHDVDDPRIMVGNVRVPQGKRLSRELLSDVESLLIHIVKPAGNIKSISSRISRPGLHVWCHNDWPYHPKLHIDE